MRFTTSVAAIAAAAIPFTNAYYKGVNVGANNPDGSCKTQQDWENAFNALKGTSQYFTSFRVYAASDCNTLEYAAPAAIATGTQLLVGVWTEDAAHYSAEKAALRAAYQAHGSDWILAISVGSEDLYRGDTDASTLAQQIYDVRGMVNADGVKVEVGHVDTWTAWVNSANEAVIKAADFIGMDGYPYFQSSSIDDAYNTFWDSVTATRNQVDNVDPGKWVWVTETGWPVSGDNYGAAVASTANAQSYWNSVGCSAIQSTHFFWYSYQDYNESPSFGLFGQNGQQTYSVDC
ncbi:glycoside hydrolase family 17 protein [Teratosphaeria destructans]|uniref:Probable glucan endo-1,3-beta-glucosidase eglC n=1 Tax=Teratosphaeria destructans TaxID=418781 RepID=A0A9W7W7E0_9PEZI|nr:glycoside hydrolase family 17 protein [Teratosphaeria destructans]